MYDIVINQEIKTKGLISFTISKDEEGNIVGEGAFKTHIYVEDINMLECYNFILFDVDVFAESFGSNDPCILYRFTFKDYNTFYDEVKYTEEQLIEIYKKESE